MGNSDKSGSHCCDFCLDERRRSRHCCGNRGDKRQPLSLSRPTGELRRRQAATLLPSCRKTAYAAFAEHKRRGKHRR